LVTGIFAHELLNYFHLPLQTITDLLTYLEIQKIVVGSLKPTIVEKVAGKLVVFKVHD